jgi:transcriptional regulator with GAF, ATPase, and Fis domain
MSSDQEASTLDRPRFDPSSIEAVQFTLEVVEGPSLGALFVVDGSQAVLAGHSETCFVRLDDRTVSRRHASIECVGRRLRIADLGSANGTFVNGIAVEIALLTGGETIRMGDTALRVSVSDTASPPAIPIATRFGTTIGASAEMRRLYPLCAKLAASNVPVVIEGETGTGKEILAESIHDEGPRRGRPFVVFDCTSVAPSLLESELFGHERGAFTGAVGDRKGVFELADGGTLLIDEIGDLDVQMQPKLLRAVERGEIRRVGGTRPVRVDVRVIAATRRDLDREVHAGRFRDDLFHRLAVARIELPPLRRRRGDVGVLASFFWEQLGGEPGALPRDLLLKWADSSWPGNVRELRNTIARQIALGELATALSQSSRAAPDGASRGDTLDDAVALDLPFSDARDRFVEQFERHYVQRLLDRHGGNVARAAAAAGIGVRYLNVLRARLRR